MCLAEALFAASQSKKEFHQVGVWLKSAADDEYATAPNGLLERRLKFAVGKLDDRYLTQFLPVALGDLFRQRHAASYCEYFGFGLHGSLIFRTLTDQSCKKWGANVIISSGMTQC